MSFDVLMVILALFLVGLNGSFVAAEFAFSSLKRVFGIDRTLATTLVGLATRVVVKIAAYTYAFYINRLLGRPQGRMKDLWA